MKKTLEVCFSPALIGEYNIEKAIVVVIDIFRATSAICYGIANGAVEIIPVGSVEACSNYKGSDYLLAAERDGSVVEGFDFGNSPYSYTAEKVAGKKIVLTTTNGTQAIQLANKAHQIIIGSFLNLQSVCNYLLTQDKNVVLLCAGWKNKFNLEDTLFAGAVVKEIKHAYTSTCDASIAAEDLYKMAQGNLRVFLHKSSHSLRLKELGIENDILFSLQRNLIEVVPVLKDGKIVTLS